MKQLETISAQSFAAYGQLLEFSPGAQDSLFEIVVTEPNHPWRLAVFRVRNRTVEKLECHPTSLESFEPMRGMGVLLVAAPEAPECCRAFLLDRPVCLHKGVWHAMLTLTEETVVKIAENLEVHSEFFDLPAPLATVLA